MVINIVILCAVLFVVFLIVVATRPADFRVTRSATITAPPATVYGNVNAMRSWEAWSPWEKLDPSMKKTYSGSEAGVGAASAWVGNSKVGEGRMTVIESRASELVRLKLEFLKPFAATNEAEFTFKPEGGATLVTWSMTGKHNFMSKAFCMFANMDKMVGGDFERGLAQLKTVSEGKA